LTVVRLCPQRTLRTTVRRAAGGFNSRKPNSRDAAATTAFSVRMIDIDHFKAVNDTFGHAIGDDLLQAFGQMLRRVWGTWLSCRPGRPRARSIS
jgi:diguanylate cyclase (GGDEF)-like protein